MVDKIIFTVTPIFSIPPRGAAAVETWMYQVAQRTNFPNRIVCIKNPGYSNTPLLMIIVVFIGLDSVAYISGYFKNGQDLILFHIHREY